MTDSWSAEYAKANWVPCGVERGALGRDSRTALKDDKRYPFVRDVLALACLKAGPDDLICLTKQDSTPAEGLTEMLREHPLAYGHRTLMVDGQKTFHPQIDLFAFTKKWWQQHQEEMPDMVMGKTSCGAECWRIC